MFPRRPLTAALLFVAAFLSSGGAAAELYAYVNEKGDYVISKKQPKAPVEYSILTDDGDRDGHQQALDRRGDVRGDGVPGGHAMCRFASGRPGMPAPISGPLGPLRHRSPPSVRAAPPRYGTSVPPVTPQRGASTVSDQESSLAFWASNS